MVFAGLRVNCDGGHFEKMAAQKLMGAISYEPLFASHPNFSGFLGITDDLLLIFISEIVHTRYVSAVEFHLYIMWYGFSGHEAGVELPVTSVLDATRDGTVIYHDLQVTRACLSRVNCKYRGQVNI